MITAITAKQWFTAQAQAAMQGLKQYRPDPADSDVQVFACRFGMVLDRLRVLLLTAPKVQP